MVARTRDRSRADETIRFPAIVSSRLRQIESAKAEAIQSVAIQHTRIQLEYIRGFCDATGIDISNADLVLLPDMSGARRTPREVPREIVTQA